jgi:DNA helicase-2/ATP-dependent DNA helicase PcrA
VGLEEGIFPLSRCADSKQELEEERRLCYVAITRAEKWLYLTYSASRFLYGNRKFSVPSRFVEEMGYMQKPPTTRQIYTEYSQNRQKSSTMSVIVPQTPNKNTSFDMSDYRVGTRVKHRKFGLGVIVTVEGTTDNCFAEIDFETVGKLKLSLNYAPLEIV